MTGGIPGGAECRDLRVGDKQFLSGRDLHDISSEYKLSCEFLSNRISRTEKKLMLVKKIRAGLGGGLALSFCSPMQINKKQNFEFSELVGTGGVSSSYSFSVCVMCESCRRRLSVNIAHECRMSNVDQGRSPASLVMLAPEPEQMK